MRFIKKKNLMEGEELLYVPRLHWAYTIKHVVCSLPFFLVLLILWNAVDPSAYLATPAGFEIALSFKLLLRHIFLISVLVVLIIFVCRIFLYLSTEYGVTNKRLIMKKGIIRVVVTEIPTDRIESIYCIQGLLGRIFRYGIIAISGVGGMTPAFAVVARPYALRRKIVDIIEKNKIINVVHGDIPRVPAPEPVKEEPVVQQEPLYRYGTFVRVLPTTDPTH